MGQGVLALQSKGSPRRLPLRLSCLSTPCVHSAVLRYPHNYQDQFKDLQKGTATLPPSLVEVFRWLGLATLILLIALAFALAEILMLFIYRRSSSCVLL